MFEIIFLNLSLFKSPITLISSLGMDKFLRVITLLDLHGLKIVF